MTRVAVTTSADRQERVGGLMRAVGLEPVELPCIEISVAERGVLEAARRAAESADAIVLTSARTVKLVWPDRMPSTPVWAVGPATAAAARHRGGQIVYVGSGGALALAEGVAAGTGVVAFPHAAGSDERAGGRLASRMAEVVEHIVYATVPVPPADAVVDAVAFLSPSAVIGWMHSRTTDDLVTGAIGATTARTMREHGVEPDVVPTSPDLVLLARGIAGAASDQIPSTPESR